MSRRKLATMTPLSELEASAQRCVPDRQLHIRAVPQHVKGSEVLGDPQCSGHGMPEKLDGVSRAERWCQTSRSTNSRTPACKRVELIRDPSLPPLEIEALPKDDPAWERYSAMAATSPLPLTGTLESVLGKKEELVVAYLMDGSNSVKDDFEAMREVLLLLIDKVGEGVTSEVMQFSSTTQIVCPWTTNIAQLKTACQKRSSYFNLLFKFLKLLISLYFVVFLVSHQPNKQRQQFHQRKPTLEGQGMALLGGGSNMRAFTELKLSFMRTIIDTSRPLVIFITDGQPDDDPRKEIDSLLQMIPTPTVIGVGVGTGTSREHLMRLLPNQPVFSVNTFAQLSTLGAEVGNTSAHQARGLFQLDISSI